MSKETVKEEILHIISEILGLSDEEISCERKLQDYGLDSIVGVELVSKLNQNYGLNLHKTAVYSYPTVNKLTDYVCDALKDNRTTYYSAEDEYNNNALSCYGRSVGEEGSVTAGYKAENKPEKVEVAEQETEKQETGEQNGLSPKKLQQLIAKMSAKYGEIPKEVYEGCTELEQLAQRISDYLNVREEFGEKKK